MIIRTFLKPEGEPGDTLLYRLRSDQLPTDANQIWKGVITMVLVNIADRAQRRYYLVKSLEELHLEEEELVYPEQVVRFE